MYKKEELEKELKNLYYKRFDMIIGFLVNELIILILVSLLDKYQLFIFLFTSIFNLVLFIIGFLYANKIYEYCKKEYSEYNELMKKTNPKHHE